jgi:hypothetical protein
MGKQKIPGTKITYRGGEPNRQKDNRAVFKNMPPSTPMTEEEYRNHFLDPKGAFMYVTDDNVYGVCKLWYKEFPFLLLEPNPVTFYYSVAYDVMHQFVECHKRLSDIIYNEADSAKAEKQLAVAYSYVFKVTSIGIIFSYLTVEAFLNQQLPEHKSIMFKGKEYSKDKIERYFSFDQKMDFIIPELAGRNFKLVHPRQRKILEELKYFRNQLIHLKQKRGSGFTKYEELYQDIINYDLRRAVNVVKAFVNFYYPKLIINYKIRSII